MKFRHGLTIVATTILFATSGLAVVPVVTDAAQSKSEVYLSQYDKAQEEVQKLNGELQKTQADINKANQDLKDINAKIQSNKKEIAKKEKELEARREAMTGQLQSLQKQQGVTGNAYLDFLLGSESLGDAVGRVGTVIRLNSANKKSLETVENTKKELDNLATDQQLEQASLKTTKQQLETNKASLKSKAVKAKQAADKADVAYKKAQADEKAAAKAAKKAAAAAAAAKTASSSNNAPASDSSSSSLSDISAAGPDGNRVSGDSAGNAYAWGQCTWFVKSVAPWAGNHWGNGNQWGASARAEGFTVNNTPSVGSIIVFAGGENVGSWNADPSYGHVAYVTAVSGSRVTITQGGMGFSNPGGPNTETINGAGRTYIHR